MKPKLIVLLGVASVFLAGAALATPPLVSSAGAVPVFKKGSICAGSGAVTESKHTVLCSELGGVISFGEIYARGWRVVSAYYVGGPGGYTYDMRFVIEEQ